MGTLDDGDAWERYVGAASRPLPAGYRPRSPETTVLHRLVRENVEPFLAEARARSEHGFGLPHFVEEEFRGYLDCGVLARGLMRLRCGGCGDEILVGFSCKKRGVCPSCTARRAVNVSAHLVDAVLPHVPMRQWVLTFPMRVRWILARKPALIGRALGIFLRALATYQRRGARREGIDGDVMSGAVTFVQRFNSALGMNIHGHVLVPDGVFAMDGVFHRLSRPRAEHVEDLLGKTAVRVLRLLERELGDDDNDDRSALALLEAAALKPVARSHGEPAPKRLTAFLEGFSLHAATHIHENDRLGLERWCRYGARGAIAISRLEELPDGRVSYQMKRALPDGRTHLVMTGMELLRKLAPLVPPPRYHLLRFAGVFAPNHKLRSLVVPKPPTKVAACAPPQSATDRPAHAQSKPDSPRQTLNWAAALKRVWGIDIFECARCKGRVKILAFIEKPSTVKAILEHLHLPSVPLPLAKARDPPQLPLNW